MNSNSENSDIDALQKRLQAVEAALLTIQQRAAFQGENLRPQWDQLYAERLDLQKRLGRQS